VLGQPFGYTAKHCNKSLLKNNVLAQMSITSTRQTSTSLPRLKLEPIPLPTAIINKLEPYLLEELGRRLVDTVKSRI
jgi:hypothetical protein